MNEPTNLITYLNTERAKLNPLLERLSIDGSLYTISDPLLGKLADQVSSYISYLKGEIDTKQNILTFDQTPTQNSTNPVTSGGIYTAINTLDSSLHAVAKSGDYNDLENLPTSYITKDVDNLTYYYTKDEITSQLGRINQFKYQIAESLPTASADTMYIIYLIATGTGTEANKDYYVEYITLNKGTEQYPSYKWEMIGTTDVSISGFVTETALQQRLDTASYIDTNELNTALSDYYTKIEINGQSYVTTPALATLLNNSSYANISYVTTELAKKQNNLTWDNQVTENSSNQVTSGSTYAAIWAAENRANSKIETLSGEAVKMINNVAPDASGKITINSESVHYVSSATAEQISGSSNYQLSIVTTDKSLLTSVAQNS